MGDFIYCIMLANGHLFIANIENYHPSWDEDKTITLDTPQSFNVVPTPGGQVNISFNHAFPFSTEDIVSIPTKNIMAIYKPENNIKEFYKQAVQEYKARKSGIILPNSGMPQATKLPNKFPKK